MITQARQAAEVLDQNFDLSDVKEAVGDVGFHDIRNGVTCDEPNDCDHVAGGQCGEVRCIHCGKRLG